MSDHCCPPTVDFRPFHDRVLVRPIKPAEKIAAGGLIVPEAVAHNEEARRGVVVAVGPGLLTRDGDRVPLMAEPGHVVLYGKFAGDGVVIDGDEYRVIRDSDIYGAQPAGAGQGGAQ